MRMSRRHPPHVPDIAAAQPHRAGPGEALQQKELPQDRELRFKILGAEYSHATSMLTATWSASAARTNLFFVAVSAAGVALALLSHATATFLILALGVLLLILVMGLVALDRMLHANREAVLYMQSVIRIRRYFTTLDPGSAEYMTLPTTDDEKGLFGAHARSSFGAMTQTPAASMASLVALIDAFVTAALIGIAFLLITGAGQSVALIAAGIALAISIAGYEGWTYRDIRNLRQSLDVRFPSGMDQ